MATSTIVGNPTIRKDSSGFFVRFPFEDIERNRSIEVLEDEFAKFQRENEQAQLKDIYLEPVGEEFNLHFKTLKGAQRVSPIDKKALVALFQKWGVPGGEKLLTHPDQNAARDALIKHIKLMKQVAGDSAVRLATAKVGSERVIMHIQSAKSVDMDELQILKNIKRASSLAELELQPVWAHVSEYGFRITLISLTKEINLRSQRGESGSALLGEGDTYFPGMHLVLSSTKYANRAEGFLFNRICQNGSIFGKRHGFNFKIDKTNGLTEHIPNFIAAGAQAVFNTLPETRNVLQKILNESFDDQPFIEMLFENEHLAKIYEKHVEQPLKELAKADTNRLQAFNRITQLAHELPIDADQQMLMEAIAGRYAYKGIDPVRNNPVTS